MPNKPNQHESAKRNPDTFIWKNFKISKLSAVEILRHSAGPIDSGVKGYLELQPENISVDFASFTETGSPIQFPQLNIRQNQDTLILSCRCAADKNKLCEHQVRALFNVMGRQEIRIFFDEELRLEKIKAFAGAYGLENEEELENFFGLEYENKKYSIICLVKDLLPVTREKNAHLKDMLLPGRIAPWLRQGDERLSKILVLKQHRYYNHFQADLMECTITSSGKLRNPLRPLNPMDFLWTTDNIDELKFYTAISRFQQNYEAEKPETEIEGLKALLKNPLQLAAYYHDATISPNLTVSSVLPVRLRNQKIEINLYVSLKKSFYTITAEVILEGKAYDLNMLNIRYKYFLFYQGVMHLIDQADLLKIIAFFRQHNNHLVIHESKFSVFQDDIISKLENRINVTYSYLKPATPEQLDERDFDHSVEKIIYLSDSENYVLITPVMKYGKVEVPVLSRKQIYATDQSGNVFSVARHKDDELRFITMLTRQHPHFSEQLDGQELYLHKKRFLDEGWFLSVFEEWRSEQITVLGFNELKGNHINPNPVKITIAVKSGLNWFDSTFEVKFGSQKVSLKHLHKSIRNKNKFIKLGDGTMGILPQEWIDKFTAYFNAGEVVEDNLRTPKVNFSGIAELYEKEVLPAEVRMELSAYKDRIRNFKEIGQLDVPAALNAELRDYQKEGLNWLNFLDEFGFGGCLADDMGLGKTIQIIAFILSQRDKGYQNTNLVVVPTTLIFNWQAEIAKFAPDLKLYTIYGADRIKDITVFNEYEVILTSYGTLLYDIGWLKKYHFNYIFLDESQTIKNPDSLRYNAVRLLQSRNKITMTGTPIENNTFDLYGQLSFACPGLLGSKQFFRDQYSTPIDKFKDNTRAIALKNKVSPFILRRTKKEVAGELPDKTEMVIYCEMGTEQKTAYDACKNEYVRYLMGEKEEDLPKHTLHVLKGLTQLRQICNSPSLLGDNLLHGISSSKIDTLMEEIESHSPQHKILVFSQFVSMLDLIRKELKARDIGFEYLTGQTKNRERRVENFQNNADVRVFLISLKAGGTGLNLTEADYVYLVDPWWNPAAENQAIDRCYRIGQKKNVVAVRLICPDTIEEKIMKLQETKKELVSDLIQTDGSMLKSLTKTDLLKLFS
ncbi:SNF2 helicase associated [Pedobacter westerhofensis]|uniref:SNF2 helicase associated n=1 Tax=Pedobacter westerhofensis TaxID=425512 RepID=A0A521FMP5_9SPHI|nr:DEAD/DEAH box helicase [Pedobacter westerhofensis]SMO97448.1 SNF2 helicase associated [Pedobacter westerhofensis]